MHAQPLLVPFTAICRIDRALRLLSKLCDLSCRSCQENPQQRSPWSRPLVPELLPDVGRKTMLWSGTRPGDTGGKVDSTWDCQCYGFCKGIFDVADGGHTPKQVLVKLSSALQTVKEVCQENALTLKMTAGKTEAVVLLQGKQAKEMKRCMFAEGEEDAAILETPAGPLRVVGSYRHLGCRVDCTRTQNAELAARRSAVALDTQFSGTGQAARAWNTECETTRFCRRSRCHHWKPSWQLTSCGWQLKS